MDDNLYRLCMISSASHFDKPFLCPVYSVLQLLRRLLPQPALQTSHFPEDSMWKKETRDEDKMTTTTTTTSTTTTTTTTTTNNESSWRIWKLPHLPGPPTPTPPLPHIRTFVNLRPVSVWPCILCKYNLLFLTIVHTPTPLALVVMPTATMGRKKEKKTLAIIVVHQIQFIYI